MESYHGVEHLVAASPHGALHVGASFSDDSLAYLTERLDASCTRLAAVEAIRRAKRNKAFDGTAHIGLAVDGATGGRCHAEACALCRPYRNQDKEIVGYRHHWAMISVVGCGLSLPFDVEPYEPGDSEYAAGQRLLKRAVANFGPRFAGYVVVDGGFTTAQKRFRHGKEHICHRHANSLLLQWLITALALTIERLYRLRYLHRGNHPPLTSIRFVRLLWISLGKAWQSDTS